jgi:hypothetical protein
VTQPEQPRIGVGVVLSSHPDDLAEWLADGRAFETAGVDALWVEIAPEAPLDPLTITAALATVTYRSLIVVADGTGGPELGRTLATIARLSRGRLRLATPVDADALALRPLDGGEESVAEVWLWVPSPENRAAWGECVAGAVERGHDRVVVAANPRLLDMLRNPDEPEERRDLYLAQG